MVTFLPVCEWRRCRFSTWGGNLHSRILPALWAGNFQLFADGPHRHFLDFAMARDAGDLVQRRVEPNTMGSTLAIQSATVLAPGAPGSAFLPGDFAFPPKSCTADRESLLGISVAESAGE